MPDGGDIRKHQGANIMQRAHNLGRRSDAGNDNLWRVPQQHRQIRPSSGDWTGARSGWRTTAPPGNRPDRRQPAIQFLHRAAIGGRERANHTARQAATTRSTPETRNIGATISGNRNRPRSAVNCVIEIRLSARSHHGSRSRADTPALACRHATARRTAWRRRGDLSRHTSTGRRGKTMLGHPSCPAHGSPR